jgi:hypothetical protein
LKAKQNSQSSTKPHSSSSSHPEHIALPPKLQPSQSIQNLPNTFPPLLIDFSNFDSYAYLPPLELAAGRNEDSNLDITITTSSTSPSFPTPGFDYPEDTDNGYLGYAIPRSPHSSNDRTAYDESSPREEEPFVRTVDYDKDTGFGSPLGGGYGVDGEYDDYLEFISKGLIEIVG